MKKINRKWIIAPGLLLNLIALFPRVSLGLNMEQAVALALQQNPTLQKQQFQQALSDEELKGRKSQNFGKIELLASYGHFNLPRTLVPLTPSSIFNDPTGVPTTQDLFTTGILYELPLFTGFSQQRSVEIAALEKEMARAAIHLSREQLIYNVKTLYVNILSLTYQRKAQKEYHAALQQLYDDIVLKVKLGKNARVDLLKAAADKENARVKLRKIGGTLNILQESLATLLNSDPIDTLEAFSMEVPQSAPVKGTQDIKDLERYRSAVLDVEKKSKLVEKSSSGYYPQVVFNGFYGHNYGPNDPTHPEAGEWNSAENWQAVVNVKWTIFDFGARSSSKQKAVIQQQQSRRERLITELELKRSLAEAATKIEMALDDFSSATTELALTRETEIIEETRFEKGEADLNDLLYAKARNQLALSRTITARYNYYSGRFYLDYLLEKGENK